MAIKVFLQHDADLDLAPVRSALAGRGELAENAMAAKSLFTDLEPRLELSGVLHLAPDADGQDEGFIAPEFLVNPGPAAQARLDRQVAQWRGFLGDIHPWLTGPAQAGDQALVMAETLGGISFFACLNHPGAQRDLIERAPQGLLEAASFMANNPYLAKRLVAVQLVPDMKVQDWCYLLLAESQDFGSFIRLAYDYDSDNLLPLEIQRHYYLFLCSPSASEAAKYMINPLREL
ncbi:MAG: hypothetical protein V1797_09135 [Pseudomonadota bacterium]